MNTSDWAAIENPLPISRESFLSKQSDPGLIKLSYFQKGQLLRAEVFFGFRTEGPPGHVHGGALAAVLDEVMGCAAWVGAFPALTARITIDYVEMVPLKSHVKVETEVEPAQGRKVRVTGRILSEDGQTVFATGSGIFVKLDDEKLARLVAHSAAATT